MAFGPYGLAKRPFQKAIINATYNLYSILLGKLISAGWYFFSMSPESRRTSLAIRNPGVNARRKLTLWEAGARPRITTNRDLVQATKRWLPFVHDIGNYIWQPPDYPLNSCDVSRLRNAIRSPRCIIYRDWMTDEHLAVEDQETSKIERWKEGGRTRENRRRSTEAGSNGARERGTLALLGLGYCLRAQYLINSAAAKEFTLEVESWVRPGLASPTKHKPPP